MKVLVTGNPNYKGLAHGIQQALEGTEHTVEFMGRWNNWNIRETDKVADYAKDFDVFVNCQYGPTGEQQNLLNDIYDKFAKGHIINIGSSKEYWRDRDDAYTANKIELHDMSKERCKWHCFGSSQIKMTYVSFGNMASESQLARNDGKVKIDLKKAGEYIKWIMEQPANINLHYLALDPVQID